MSSTLGVSSMKRHEEYYFRDGTISFVVEDTTFCLHRHFFERESQYFRDRLNPATSEVGLPDSPYIIRDVKVDEFAQFLWIWYNPRYSFSEKGKQYWLTILRLATRWQFPEIRNLAIRQLEKLDLEAIEKIVIYKEFEVDPSLLLSSYVSLCRNKDLPSPTEGKMLSMETVLKLASAREQILLSAKTSGCKSPTTASAPDDVTRVIIAKLFELNISPNEEYVKVERQAKINGHSSGDDTSVDTGAAAIKESKKGKGPLSERLQDASQNGGSSGIGKGKK